MAALLGQPVSNLGTNEIREDLIDVIENVDPVDTPLFSMTANVRAKSIFHEWMKDSYTAVDNSGATEGQVLTVTNEGRPSRLSNTCQIFRKDFGVSDTEEAVTKAGISSMFSYQAMKAMRAVARNTENALVLQTESTAGAAVRTMDGLDTFIVSGGGKTVAGAASMRLADFSQLQQDVYSVSGVQPDTALVSPLQKRAISTWYTTVTKEMGNVSTRLGLSIMEALTDFGPMRFVMERYLATTNATTDARALIFPVDLVRKAWLEPVRVERQSKDGDIIPGMLIQQLTLEVLNPTAMGAITSGTNAPTYP